MEYALALLVLVAVVAVVLSLPLRRRGVAERREETRVAELEAAKEAKYREIRDAELDHQMGKLSREDWRSVDRDLRGEAIEILRELDRLEGRLPQGGGWTVRMKEGSDPLDDPLDLQQDDHVHREQRREEDRPPVQVPLHERSATEGARPGSDAERAGQPGVLAGVQQDEHDHDDREDHLKAAEDGFHGERG